MGRSQTPGREGLPLPSFTLRGPAPERHQQQAWCGGSSTLLRPWASGLEGVGAAQGQEPKANTGGARYEVRTALLFGAGQVSTAVGMPFPVALAGGEAGPTRGREVESTSGLLTPHPLPALTASPVPTTKGTCPLRGRTSNLKPPPTLRTASVSAQPGEEGGCPHPPPTHQVETCQTKHCHPTACGSAGGAA